MSETQRASELQEGGRHYKDMPIQPAEFCQRNRLNWCEANAVKYVVRHASKNGAQDIRKAIHYLNLLLEWEYPHHGKTAADYTPLSPPEVKEIVESVAPVMACDNCLRKNCGLNPLGPVPVCGHHLPPAGEMPLWPTPPLSDEWETKDLCRRCDYKPCGDSGTKQKTAKCDTYASRTKQPHLACSPVSVAEKQIALETAAASPAPLSLSLPSITVEGSLEDVAAKYWEERSEWENSDGISQLIEGWDVIQVRQTLAERGGDLRYFADNSEWWMRQQHKEYPERLEAAKRSMLQKNAARAYYAPEVCEKIVMSAGHNW